MYMLTGFVLGLLVYYGLARFRDYVDNWIH